MFHAIQEPEYLGQLVREVLPAASKSAGRKVNSSLVIVDLQGFGYVAVATFCSSY